MFDLDYATLSRFLVRTKADESFAPSVIAVKGIDTGTQNMNDTTERTVSHCTCLILHFVPLQMNQDG